MKNIIILLATLVLVYNSKSLSARHAKKNSFMRVAKSQIPNGNNNITQGSMPQLQQKQATNQIATLPGFKKMQLLDPNFLNQASSNPVVNNNGMQLTANVGNTPYYGVQQNNSNQMMAVNNTMPQGNNIIDYNHHTANSAPVKLANQMNAIYNQNKQNQTPQGSAYQQYQFQNNVSNPVVQQQPQMQLQPQSQQMVLPINNNQTQSTLTMPYGNNQNVQYSALNQNNNIQNLNPQYVVA